MCGVVDWRKEGVDDNWDLEIEGIRSKGVVVSAVCVMCDGCKA